MTYEELETLINSMREKIGEDSSALISEDTLKKIELMDDYGIVRCSKEAFEKIDKNDYEKYKVNKYEYDVLVADKKQFKKKYDFKVIDKPTLDDIMVIYIKGKK